MAEKITSAQRAERERAVWELSSKGWTQARIAEYIGVSQQAVSKMLIKLSSRAVRGLDDEIAMRKMVQVSQLEEIIDISFRAWDRSTDSKKKVSKKTASGPGPGRRGQNQTEEETTLATETLLGDTRYLDQARAAMGDIRKILGLDAPVQSEITEKKVLFYLPNKQPAPGTDEQ